MPSRPEHAKHVLTPAQMVQFAPPRKTPVWPIWFALSVSLIMHAGIIKTHFVDPLLHALNNMPRKLEVVLVNSKHARPPADPQALAQANLDGGGNTEQDRMAKSPLPARDQDQNGDSLEQMRKQQQALSAENAELLEQVHQQKTAKTQVQLVEKVLPQPGEQTLDGTDALQRDLEIARLEAQISKEYEAYQKKPRRKYVTARTLESQSALYYSVWKSKIEHVGELNYPVGLYGVLKLVVTIRPDGSMDSIEIIKSSGNKRLDASAVHIVKQSAPFKIPSRSLLGDDNRLSIISTFTFMNSGKLSSKLGDE